jgi:hypothetical protein
MFLYLIPKWPPHRPGQWFQLYKMIKESDLWIFETPWGFDVFPEICTIWIFFKSLVLSGLGLPIRRGTALDQSFRPF